MLEYNTTRESLVIPEYGRHIQKMVQHVCEIKDPVERNRMAQSIITVMGNLNPHLRDVAQFQHKLWDQLFIISNFQLDVECPYPIISKEIFSKKPEKLDYPISNLKYRFYGNYIKKMIDETIKVTEEEVKLKMIVMIANYMKKLYLNWNKNTVEDKIIFLHLKEMSQGQLDLTNTKTMLTDSSKLIRANPPTKNNHGHQRRPKNYSNYKQRKNYK